MRQKKKEKKTMLIIHEVKNNWQNANYNLSYPVGRETNTSFPIKKANTASECFFSDKYQASFPFVAIVVIIGDGLTYILDRRSHLLKRGLTFQVFPERTDQPQLTRPFLCLEGGAGYTRLM